ncbi:hypothetical protein MTO96_051390 [Rhipicephalus appendiculatus]
MAASWPAWLTICSSVLVKLHYSGQKLYKHASGGTPITEMGDRIKQHWDKWVAKCTGEEKPAAAMGDASRWDHSMYPALMALEVEFVSSFYGEEHWTAIKTALEHVCWPICFTPLSFCFTNPGQHASGHVFTWMNSFLNTVLHEWGWKKTLEILLEADLDDYLTFEVDGDDNYHISTPSVINPDNMEQLRINIQQLNIKIRSKTFDGYRITDRPTDIDYLSHYYAPVYIRCVEGPGVVRWDRVHAGQVSVGPGLFDPDYHLEVNKATGIVEEDIAKDYVHEVHGGVAVIPHDKWALKDDVVPCIFPNCPKYLSRQ